MKFLPLIAISAITATPALADETRQLDAHEHGVGQLDIAFEGTQIAMELHAPGADIVGFEYAASSAEDRAKVDAAVATLARPLDLFQLPAAAACSVVQASAALETEDDHDEHEHAEHADEHDHDEHEHAEHADEHDHDEHEHAEHADEHDHDEHEHAEHADKDDHDEHAHADGAQHSEFHAEYLLDCADPAAVSSISFAYFDVFENAQEVEVQLITNKGANAFEVERDAPVLDLRGMF